MKINFISLQYILIVIAMLACTSNEISNFAISNTGSLYNLANENKLIENSGKVNKDFDHDGIPNIVDKCISIPETYNFYMDQDGCPDKYNYSDEKLEIKYVKFCVQNTYSLTKNIKELLNLKFLPVIANYPHNYWILDVRSFKDAAKKALSFKKYFDKNEISKDKIRIISSKSEFNSVFLLVDDKKAKEIAIKKILVHKNDKK